MIRDLPNLYQEYPFLKGVDSCSLRCSLFDLDDFFKRYFKQQNNYPKFKGKYSSKRSYRTNYITSTYKEKKYENIKVDLKKRLNLINRFFLSLLFLHFLLRYSFLLL